MLCSSQVPYRNEQKNCHKLPNCLLTYKTVIIYAYDTIGRFLSSRFGNQFKDSTPCPPSGQPTGICHLCPGRKEFDTKRLPMNGEFESCLGRVGNFNCKCQVHVVIPGMEKLKKKYCFCKRMDDKLRAANQIFAAFLKVRLKTS